MANLCPSYFTRTTRCRGKSTGRCLLRSLDLRDMIRRLAVPIAIIALLAGCRASQAVDIPSGPPSIRGTITNSTAATGGDRLGSILVEEVPSDQSGSAKSSVRVTRETRILVRGTTGLKRGTFADLLTGQIAEAWFTGPVMESYPTQATASVVVVNADS